MLLERGADVESPSLTNKSALHRACEYGNPDAVKLLLSFGADPTRKDSLGRSPLHFAAKRKNMVFLFRF